LREKEERGREVRSHVIDSLPHSEGLKPVDYVENTSTLGNTHPFLVALRGGKWERTIRNNDGLGLGLDYRRTSNKSRAARKRVHKALGL